MESPNNVALLNEFEKLRKQLECVVLKYGFTDPSVLSLSQQLDKVHNEIIRLQ